MLENYSDLYNPEQVRLWIQAENDPRTLRILVALEDALHAGDEIGAAEAVDDLTELMIFHRGEGL